MRTFNWGDYGGHEGGLFIGNRESTMNHARPINAYKDGVYVGTYSTISDAAKMLNIGRDTIQCAMRETRTTLNGYSFTEVKHKQAV